MKNEIIEIYKQYEIIVAPVFQRQFKFNFCHVDYSGPPDKRCGFAKTIEECKQQIDELEYLK